MQSAAAAAAPFLVRAMLDDALPHRDLALLVALAAALATGVGALAGVSSRGRDRVRRAGRLPAPHHDRGQPAVRPAGSLGRGYRVGLPGGPHPRPHRGLPDGYHTRVGDRGHRFSRGERQRLSLARLLLRDPPVVVLDEATSALDTRTEAAVRATIADRASARTTVVIAHRLSTASALSARPRAVARPTVVSPLPGGSTR